MRYREAKNLQEGDLIVRKYDKVRLTVQSVEFLGQFKLARITCLDPEGIRFTYYNSDVDWE